MAASDKKLFALRRPLRVTTAYSTYPFFNYFFYQTNGAITGLIAWTLILYQTLWVSLCPMEKT